MIFCDECENFPTYKQFQETNGSFCLAKQRMRFRMPRSYTDTEWGFNRKTCNSFVPIRKKEKAKTFKKRCSSCNYYYWVDGPDS